MQAPLSYALAFCLPPLGVYLHFGRSKELLWSLLLMMFGFIPGVIYAVYVISIDLESV